MVVEVNDFVEIRCYICDNRVDNLLVCENCPHSCCEACAEHLLERYFPDDPVNPTRIVKCCHTCRLPAGTLRKINATSLQISWKPGVEDIVRESRRLHRIYDQQLTTVLRENRDSVRDNVLQLVASAHASEPGTPFDCCCC